MILTYCEQHDLTASEFFLEHVHVGRMPEEFAYAFPIYNGKHAELCRQVVDCIGEVLLEEEDTSALRSVLRQTKRIFSARAAMVSHNDESDFKSQAVQAVASTTSC